MFGKIQFDSFNHSLCIEVLGLQPLTVDPNESQPMTMQLHILAGLSERGEPLSTAV